MTQEEFVPGEAAPRAGPYVALNVLGQATATMAEMREGETFPVLPRGFTWKPLGAYSNTELRERAAHYRSMAATASTGVVRDGLLKAAERFDALADQREESA